MGVGKDGQKQLDFRNYLCIQIVPSFVVEDILLKRRIGTPDPKEYRDVPGEKSFLLWRKRTYRLFKMTLSDASVVATQLLSDGTVKEWKDLVISPGAVEWHRKGGKLKEFPKGPVTFRAIKSLKRASCIC
jgi:hypothetical protein